MARIRSLRSLPQSFEGLLGHLGVILSSNVVVAILTFGTFALTSRALSPEGVGLLVLAEAYGRMFDLVLRLEPSQALIRMAMPHRNAPDSAPFRRLVRFALLLDAGGSVLASLVALACVPLLSGWFGFDKEMQFLVALYCLTLLIPAPMTAIALFRLFGRFGIYARVNVLTAALRLAATGALLLADGGLGAFVVLLCVMSCVDRLLPTLWCWPLLRRQAGPSVLSTPLAGLHRENEGLWRFIVTANLNVLARNSTRQFDVAALGGFLAPAELGFYVLAKRFAMLVFRLGAPIQLAVYPKMCELVTQNAMARLWRFVAAFLVGFLGLSACGLVAFVLVGRPLVSFAFGPDFVSAVPNILIQLAGASLLLVGTIFHSAAQAFRRTSQLMAVSIVVATAFFILIPVLVPYYGLLAASYLSLLVGLLWCGGCVLVFSRAIGTTWQRVHTED